MSKQKRINPFLDGRHSSIEAFELANDQEKEERRTENFQKPPRPNAIRALIVLATLTEEENRKGLTRQEIFDKGKLKGLPSIDTHWLTTDFGGNDLEKRYRNEVIYLISALTREFVTSNNNFGRVRYSITNKGPYSQVFDPPTRLSSSQRGGGNIKHTQ